LKLFGNLCPVKTFTSCAISEKSFKSWISNDNESYGISLEEHQKLKEGVEISKTAMIEVSNLQYFLTSHR